MSKKKVTKHTKNEEDDSMEMELEKYNVEETGFKIKKDKFSDVYDIGEQFAKILGINSREDVKKLLKEK